MALQLPYRAEHGRRPKVTILQIGAAQVYAFVVCVLNEARMSLNGLRLM